ncbi:hypothetical protein BST81_19910 [Leptolyngbya sp. 'hensonii']|uniref:response regulator n=1 Tax=Leptolyngbya sp. 'hensonii' TaxID=1922337 RepID=UPI00094F9B24|nr:response regulator [Leptolyngbya sp. 'hensonii']OLP16706.1 hypothetical protein BST81_19910 [Leptolyngbya sp. 'hensonii']
MLVAPFPDDEDERLQALQKYSILDTPEEAGFDELTQLASLICEVPIALISLIDTHRQWFKSKVGLDTTETSRDVAFCPHAILQRDLFVVTDTHQDGRFKDNPLVTADPKIRFYAGAPLITPENHAIGTLCVIDQVPRTLNALQQQTLITLAHQVVSQLELRHHLKRLEQLCQYQKQTEIALQRQVLVFEYSHDGLVLTHLDGTIVDWNPAAERMFGWTKAEILGKSINQIKAAQNSITLPQVVNRVIYQGHWSGEVQFKRKDKSQGICETVIVPLKNEQNQIVALLGTYQDITKRKQAEMRLQEQMQQAVLLNQTLESAKKLAEQADRTKSEFLAVMSHEIRTPMNAIIGMTGLLLDTPLTPQQRDFVETTRNAGDALLTVINDILDFSKIEAGKLELEEQPFSLRDCVEGALDLLAAKAAEKGIELLYLIDQSVPEYLLGDVTRLRQVLVNLISNGIKFTERGEVLISLTAQPINRAGTPSLYEIQFAVKDTGLGIPADRLDRLFQPFSQVDASTTRKYGGTGLGLVISQRLTEMMGGWIWVNSQPGQGSTFFFTIQGEATLQRPVVNPYMVPLQGKRLLIVDDNGTNLNILKLQVESWGMVVETADSGKAALQVLDRSPRFDLAILDMQMPEMDGINLALAIAQHPVHRQLPVIMLTSLAQSRSQVPGIHLAAYLNKPVKQSQLCEILSQVLTQQGDRASAVPAVPALIDPEVSARCPLRILLAEDNIVNQKVALHLLQRMGYRADMAANGLEVLQMLRLQPYDVILMDVQMPEMDGLEAARQIQLMWTGAGQEPPPDWSKPQIIAMTANAMQGDREQCLQAGMDSYISKPVQAKELAQVLCQCHLQSARLALPDPEPAVDRPALMEFVEQLAGSEPEVQQAFLAELVKTFVEVGDELVQLMHRAIATLDPKSLQRAAHSLKSSSASLKAHGLSVLCQTLEDGVAQGKLEGIEAQVAELEAEYDRVKSQFQDVLKA